MQNGFRRIGFGIPPQNDLLVYGDSVRKRAARLHKIIHDVLRGFLRRSLRDVMRFVYKVLRVIFRLFCARLCSFRSRLCRFCRFLCGLCCRCRCGCTPRGGLGFRLRRFCCRLRRFCRRGAGSRCACRICRRLRALLRGQSPFAVCLLQLLQRRENLRQKRFVIVRRVGKYNGHALFNLKGRRRRGDRVSVPVASLRVDIELQINGAVILRDRPRNRVPPDVELRSVRLLYSRQRRIRVHAHTRRGSPFSRRKPESHRHGTGRRKRAYKVYRVHVDGALKDIFRVYPYDLPLAVDIKIHTVNPPVLL